MLEMRSGCECCDKDLPPHGDFEGRPEWPEREWIRTA